MKMLSTYIGLCISSLLATAQNSELTRLLARDYQLKPLEQAERTLTAINIISSASAVEYSAGQSVVLMSGFVAKTGSVFTARQALFPYSL